MADYQYLFEEDFDKNVMLQNKWHFRRWQHPQYGPKRHSSSRRSHPREPHYTYSSPVHGLLVKHLTSSISPEEIRLTAEDINEERFRHREQDEFARLTFIKSPPRLTAEEAGIKGNTNPLAPFPFDEETFYKFIDILHFHKASFSYSGVGRVSKLTGPNNITSIYVENYSHESRWYKICIAYDPLYMRTSVFPHNLNAEESNVILSALENRSNFLFTIHPLFVLLLAFEMLYQFCLTELYRLFGSQIHLERALGLGPYVPRNLKANENINNKAAFAKAYGDGKALCGLEERMEYNIMMGKKILLFFKDLNDITPEGPGKASFVKAGGMIKTKLEYLVESLELQFPRLRRAKANNELNRTGLENRLTTQTNTLSYQIASETRSDSSAMKAIAVLTMLFLPGTFLASFFAMPLFNWDAETQEEVVNRRFWIYWAVTIPGTILVLGCWRIWWIWREGEFVREERRKERNRKEEEGEDEEGSRWDSRTWLDGRSGKGEGKEVNP